MRAAAPAVTRGRRNLNREFSATFGEARRAAGSRDQDRRLIEEPQLSSLCWCVRLTTNCTYRRRRSGCLYAFRPPEGETDAHFVCRSPNDLTSSQSRAGSKIFKSKAFGSTASLRKLQTSPERRNVANDAIAGKRRVVLGITIAGAKMRVRGNRRRSNIRTTECAGNSFPNSRADHVQKLKARLPKSFKEPVRTRSGELKPPQLFEWDFFALRLVFRKGLGPGEENRKK